MRNLLIIFLLLITNSWAFCQSFGLISKTSAPLLIDGLTEISWDAASEYPINKKFAGSYRNSSDLSASWKSLWDDQNIYFFISVSDDSLYNLGAAASKFWIHDCVEIFFDLLNNKDLINTDNSPTDDNYQYRFIWNLDQEPIYENPPSLGIQNVSHTVIVDSVITGYNVEIKIPWATIIGTHPFGTPSIGKKIGLELKVADLDHSTVPAGVWAPDAEITWNNSLGKDLKISANFGTIQLSSDALSDLTPPAAISDFTAIPAGSSSAELSFTSPADSNTGNSFAYQIKYSTDSLTADNWASAINTDTVPQPLAQGTAQSILVNNLPEGSFLWLAMRSEDYFGNISDISNCIKIRTFDPDAIPPSEITDLKADSVGSFVVYLSFTATGDDGLTGVANSYDLRYIEGILNADNWDMAIPVNGISAPSIAGTNEKIKIGGLKSSKNYSFGIIVSDERPNQSGISNILTLTTPAYIHKPVYTMDKFIGTNAFIDVPQDKMKALGFIREYHPWSFTEEVNDQFEYNKWNGFWDFDNYYKSLKAANIDVCPALWGSPSWLQPSDLNKPVVGSENPLLPNSYREMSEMMFQYAARYGNVVIDNSKLIVAAGQVKKSGLAYLHFYEDWNEQDRTWEGPDKRFTAQQYAAMVSANVDGNAGTMGPNLGIKQADPSARFVMGGLAGIGTAYISDMMKWFEQNRPDGQWPVDVINMHHYCENNGLIGNSPEDNQLKQKVEAVSKWRDEFAPGNEFWLTEFGYDMNSLSVDRVPVFAGFTQEQVQAQWLLRSFLVLSSTGVDRAAQFMLRNQEPGNAEPRFRDCGLTSSHNTGYLPKLSWYCVYTMKNILTGLYFNQVITENTDVWAYRYTHPDLPKQVVALWCPTSSGKTFNYRLPVPLGYNHAEIIVPNNTIGGERIIPEITAGKIFVNVSEMPVFVEFSFSNSAAEISPVNELFIYPNPVVSTMMIQWPLEFNNQSAKVVDISDISGRICIHKTVESGSGINVVNLNSLNPGNYIVTAVQSGKIFRQRIVKAY